MVESIQINEDEPDVQDIMRQIRAYIAERKLSGGTVHTDGQRLEGQFSPDVYDHLFQAINAADMICVEANARPFQIPLLGPILTRAREMLHGLIIYYLGQLATRQIRFNTHSVQALNALIHDLDATKESDAQTARIAMLEKRLAALEAQLAAPSSQPPLHEPKA